MFVSMVTPAGFIAIVLDAPARGALLMVKARTDILVVLVAALDLAVIIAGEWLFLRHKQQQ